MARDIQQFSCTIPAGTPASAPVTVNMTMPARIIESVIISIPPGPRGELGFALAAAGVQYLPSNAGGFVVADNATFTWDLEGVIESGAWQLIGYNTGYFNHTISVIFLCDLPGDVPLPPAGPTTIATAQQSLIGHSVL